MHIHAPTGIRIDPLNGSCWNGLGLSLSTGAGSDNSVSLSAAQSCFVRAAQLESSAPAFANLGK